jgi:hypothetical protein
MSFACLMHSQVRRFAYLLPLRCPVYFPRELFAVPYYFPVALSPNRVTARHER